MSRGAEQTLLETGHTDGQQTKKTLNVINYQRNGN